MARLGRGIFRLTHFQPHEHQDLILLWLWSERLGVFSHHTALYLSGLCDERIIPHQMIVPLSWKRRRLKLPENLGLHYEDLPSEQIEELTPLRVTHPTRTFADCLLANTRHDLIQEATRRRESTQPTPPKTQERQKTPQNELIEDLNSLLAALGSTHRLPGV